MRPARIRDMLMDDKETIVKQVKQINLDDPKELLEFVTNPFEIDAISELKKSPNDEWRDKVVGFVENINSTYNVEHIKSEINLAIQSRTKQERFYGSLTKGFVISIAVGIIYWNVFGFWTGAIQFLVLFSLFYIGYESVNKISKQYFTGDTLRLVEDYKNVIK